MKTLGDLLRRLFKSYQARDDDAFRAAALEIIASERQKNHNLLADDLQRILANGTKSNHNSTGLRRFDQLPKDTDRGTILLDVRTPDAYLDDIVLVDELRQQLLNILDEVRARDLLRTYGLQARRKLLFCGPPGCGKTLCAEVLAGELGLPMLYTRFDAVISSFLGETASNLRKVFDYASRGTWVLFFDEFDAIGKSRNDTEEHGELKRVVNTFLQLLDNFGGETIFIAATNHEGLLDRALWRRFDEVLYFDRPKNGQIQTLIDVKLRGVRHKDLSIQKFIPQMTGWSHADIERVCIDATKIGILTGTDELTDKIFAEAVWRQLNRIRLTQEMQGG